MPSPDDPTLQTAKSSAPIRLDHASIMTTSLEAATTFYTNTLGLTLRAVEDDPIRTNRRRAMLSDADGYDVLELIEMPELGHPTIPGRGGIHHLGFRLPPQDWRTLRARLDATGHPYQELHGCLFLRDADGLVLEIEQAR